VTASDRGEGSEAGGLRSLVSLFALTGCLTTKPDPAQFEAAGGKLSGEGRAKRWAGQALGKDQIRPDFGVRLIAERGLARHARPPRRFNRRLPD
jgi:hypothetical protein